MSVFALHPLYLKLSPLLEEAALVAGPGRAHVFAALRLELEKARHALDLKEVDYEATIAVKMSIAKRCLKETAVRTTFLESKAFKTFLQEQQGWLKPYVLGLSQIQAHCFTQAGDCLSIHRPIHD
jgi:4-alpha-glucanotransferase